MRRKTVLCLMLGGLAFGSARSARADEVQPSPAPVTWELTFKPGPLQRVNVGGRTYWCLVYRVVNNTGQDVDFLPDFERVSEIDNEMTLEQIERNPNAGPKLIVQPALVGADASVFKSIKQMHARTHPLMVSPVGAIGRILQGLDNSRESVAIFPDLEPGVSRFTIYVGGLSGERQVLPNPVWKSKTGDAEKPGAAGAKPAGGASKAAAVGSKDARQFVVQKSLALPYSLAGDRNRAGVLLPQLGDVKWVMR